jgi:uncharacterized protein YndB with AHSA1/START domain
VPKPFEIVIDEEVGATPEQVWDAITEGPQVDSWFMGASSIEPREGGAGRIEHPAFTMESTVRVWEPPTRLALRSTTDPEGGFHDFEYQVERSPEGSAVRWVHSGALGGDDWEREYAAMNEGDAMYVHKLIEYLTYFRGRHAVTVDAYGPNLGEGKTWEVFREPLGLTTDPELERPIVITPDGFDPIAGVTDHLTNAFLGVRTDDAMYRFIMGFDGSTLVGHHLFAEDVDRAAATEAWQDWITRAFA